MTLLVATVGTKVMADFAITAMASAVKAIYSIPGEISEYLDSHISEMTSSDNPTIARTGRVLDMAKFGFGLGYISSTIVIATGQIILGNPILGALGAAKVVGTALTLTNPIAMTCAAVGAIFYGWGALSDVERSEILGKVAEGFEVGIELIRSILAFIIKSTSELLSSNNLDEIKRYVSGVAESFGRSLSDVTHQISDVVSDSLGFIKKNRVWFLIKPLMPQPRSTDMRLMARGNFMMK